jgi:tryptophan-rich sensory protein
MTLSSILSLSVFVLACTATATSGAFFRPDAWYRQLAKPSWQPPDWLFAPAWLVLYATIAFAGWLIWQQWGVEGVGLALTIYAVQLVLNALWSAIFFGLRRPDLAFLEVVCLWLSVVATIAAFYPIDKTAAYILIPYLCWVSFAAALNFRVWRLNPRHA